MIRSLVREATRTGDLTPFATPALAMLYLSGGVICLVLAVMPGSTAPLAIAGVGLGASGVGLGLGLTQRRLGTLTLNLLIAAATLTVSLLSAVTGQTGRPEALAFVWIGLYCGVFMTTRAQMGQLALITVSFTAAIAWRDTPGMGTDDVVRHAVIVAGAVAAGLAWIGLLRRLIETLIVQQTNIARTDGLTGLPNRTELRRRGRALLATHGRATMLLVDLDDFKLVNDRWGHDVGDRVLRVVARRLDEACAGDDLVTRLGGDEFAVLQAGDHRATDTASMIADALDDPIHVGDVHVQVDVSIGVAFAEQHEDLDELLSEADLAMHAAKASGHGWHSFEPSMRADAHERRRLVSGLRDALEREQFSLRFQPIVQLDTLRTRAAEALVRWEHPDRGVVGPDRFIPVAETSGLIVPLGQWVLRQACETAVGWPGDRPAYVTVNLSPRQLLDGQVLADVDETLERVGMAPERLVLEITETSVMTEPDLAIRRLVELVDLGVSLAIDDFGTGYSSLEYLRRLPVRTVKLARTFILDLTESPRDAAFAAGVIDLSHTLGKVVVAEGIETHAQRRMLTDMGCDLAQGYLFDRPLEVGGIRARLDRESVDASVSAPETTATGVPPRSAPASPR